MNRNNVRFFIGGALVLLGVLMLLERFGIFQAAVEIFWGVIFLAAGAYFLYRFVLNMSAEWWALIPGFALIGIGTSTILPGAWSGFSFLGFLGISFLAIYLSNRQRWWAIIPGGVLITLAVVSLLSNNRFGAQEQGGFFFLGLGLTFLLVAILASMQWAYIPGVILLLMGVALGYTPFAGSLNYVWPAALILIGLLLIFQFARSR
jgi:hypothetical protein